MNDKDYYIHNIAAKFISGKDVEVQLEGNSAELDAFYDLLQVSRKLKEALDKNENIENISCLLENKKILTKKFEELSSITWRL